MNEERRRILEMLAKDKITVEEAERLLNAVDGRPDEARAAESTAATRTDAKPKAKYLRVQVDSDEEHVDVRVPLQMLRAGIKLGALVPQSAREKIDDKLAEKGIDFDISNLKPEMIEELIDSFSELKVDVKDGDEHVSVFCE